MEAFLFLGCMQIARGLFLLSLPRGSGFTTRALNGMAMNAQREEVCS